MFSRLATPALFLLITVLPAPGVRATETFVAEMEVIFNDATSMARVWAQPGRLRMAMQGGRTATGMLADYTQGKAWALMPGAHRYQAFPIDSLRATVPHFFDPGLEIVRKEKIGRDTVTGQEAIKYRVALKAADGRTYSGWYWESIALPGYPLKWRDGQQAVTALWHRAELQDMPEAFFTLPTGYIEQKPSPTASIYGPRCREKAEAQTEIDARAN